MYKAQPLFYIVPLPLAVELFRQPPKLPWNIHAESHSFQHPVKSP